MEITIKPLTTKDIKLAAEVFCKSFNTVGQKWNLETAIKRLEQYHNAESCWIAESNSKIIGVITTKLDNVLDHQELYIDIIAVDPEHHKSGAGTKLMQTALDYSKAQGYEAVWLTASSSLPSYNWYLKTGFRETNWKVFTKNLN